MLDGNFTDKVMVVVVIIFAVCLAPIALIKSIYKKAKEMKDYFSNNRVIFNGKKKK